MTNKDFIVKANDKEILTIKEDIKLKDLIEQLEANNVTNDDKIEIVRM